MFISMGFCSIDQLSPTETKIQQLRQIASLFILGYNRFPMNDFPRLVVCDIL
jgi:hypothetical protein